MGGSLYDFLLDGIHRADTKVFIETPDGRLLPVRSSRQRWDGSPGDSTSSRSTPATG